MSYTQGTERHHMNENSLAWRGKQQSNNYITKEVSNEINEINNGEG